MSYLQKIKYLLLLLLLIIVYSSKDLTFYDVKRFSTYTNHRRHLARIFTATLFSCPSDVVDVVSVQSTLHELLTRILSTSKITNYNCRSTCIIAKMAL